MIPDFLANTGAKSGETSLSVLYWGNFSGSGHLIKNHPQQRGYHDKDMGLVRHCGRIFFSPCPPSKSLRSNQKTFQKSAEIPNKKNIKEGAQTPRKRRKDVVFFFSCQDTRHRGVLGDARHCGFSQGIFAGSSKLSEAALRLLLAKWVGGAQRHVDDVNPIRTEIIINEFLGSLVPLRSQKFGFEVSPRSVRLPQ